MNNTDCHFEIGSTHNVCEDYALAGEYRAFLSDGCSTGLYTDVGARLICHTAFGMQDRYCTPERIMYEVNAARRVLVLPRECTRATLFSGFCCDDHYSVSAVGDGAIVAVGHDKSVRVWEIEYPSGAPMYPAYMADRREMEAYMEEFGAERKTTYIRLDTPSEAWKEEFPLLAMTNHDRVVV